MKCYGNVFGLLAIALSACQFLSLPAVAGSAVVDNGEPSAECKWKNIYAGSPKLAGVIVDLSPEVCITEFRNEWSGKHPYCITYVFWDGTLRLVLYKPNGEVTGGWWVKGKDKFKQGSSAWNRVDFTFGSDPNFKTHTDPRKKMNPRANQ